MGVRVHAGVSRSMTFAVSPRFAAIAATRSSSARLSTTIRPSPMSRGAVDLAVGLVVAVQREGGTGMPALAATASPRRRRCRAGGPPPRPSGRRRCTGTTCRRSRRPLPRRCPRRLIKGVLERAARARKSVSLITNSGVPNCRCSSLTGIPSMASSPPSLRSTPAAHIGGCRALRSAGTASQSGASGEAFEELSGFASWRSHPFRRRNAQQFQSVGQHLAGGIVEPEPGAVQVRDGFLAQRRDTAGVVPAV